MGRALPATLALALLLAGCCGKPWWRFRDMPGPPDVSYRTGSVAGYDVYIWECLDGRRTVIYQYSAEMMCRKAQKQVVECGEIAPIEKELEDDVREPVPDVMAWPEK